MSTFSSLAQTINPLDAAERFATLPAETTPTKRLFIKTYGCQMNVYDSERMEEALVPLGFQATDQVDTADLIIVNTCHIRAKAEDKLFSELGRFRIVKNKRKEWAEKQKSNSNDGSPSQILEHPASKATTQSNPTKTKPT